MIFNSHNNLAGKHAFLGASQFRWINYDEDKLRDRYRAFQTTLKGTELHEFASKCILMHHYQRDDGNTINQFVNDAIELGMESEKTLYYSNNCFGTADAIKFDEAEKILRIHDLKTGSTPTHMEQLYVYSALFCLEYFYRPEDITTILRIYQSGEVNEEVADPIVIREIMEKIIKYDQIIDEMKGAN